ncbi:uncharacterized protein LOC114521069 [Dendronephthya gigantea]|uniref:uncharacterized protein LOC114521069 n=1 Tax=Dendronephthya gigantea TaxID=151771 RepID=UPI00106B93BF|nr:uncharacterized protein LOC114521069 [Dendronephthya gigantea]XP_028397270.1 uncharacterized protein LOC114521069 [Dendronephthya gigantea]
MSCHSAHIKVTKKTENNARVYDRKHAFTYCGQLCAKIARHLVTKHKMEEEVMSALAHKKKSSERRTILDKLLQGDYHHNMNTLETGEEELIIVRRPGEDGKYRIEDFLPCEFCLGFFRSLNMVETRGKRGRKVPIIHLLNSLRSKVGINEENGYVFARVNRDSLEPLRGWDCLRYCATECQPKLKNPDAITSTKLRKYILTITQVLSLEEKKLDWLAKHLGHDIRTHREYYRLHGSTIEIAKISKLLLAVDSGRACSLKGKSLEEITLEDISEPELSEDEKGDCEETNSDEVLYMLKNHKLLRRYTTGGQLQRLVLSILY